MKCSSATQLAPFHFQYMLCIAPHPPVLATGKPACAHLPFNHSYCPTLFPFSCAEVSARKAQALAQAAVALRDQVSTSQSSIRALQQLLAEAPDIMPQSLLLARTAASSTASLLDVQTQLLSLQRAVQNGEPGAATSALLGTRKLQVTSRASEQAMRQAREKLDSVSWVADRLGYVSQHVATALKMRMQAVDHMRLEATAQAAVIEGQESVAATQKEAAAVARAALLLEDSGHEHAALLSAAATRAQKAAEDAQAAAEGTAASAGAQELLQAAEQELQLAQLYHRLLELVSADLHAFWSTEL